MRRIAPLFLVAVCVAFWASLTIDTRAQFGQKLPKGIIVNDEMIIDWVSGPSSDGGQMCIGNGELCKQWIVLTIGPAQHVSQGVHDPPCAADPDAAAKELRKMIERKDHAIAQLFAGGGSAIGGIPGAIAGGLFGSAVAQGVTPDTPLGQFMIHPADKSFCTVVPLIIPAAAEQPTFRYWADQLQNRKLGQAPTLEMLGQVSPDSDIAWAKFEKARAKELVDLRAYGGQPARYVWTVFKRWTGGGIPRLAGLEVTYRLPKK